MTTLNWDSTALVMIDPQVDTLSPEGKGWDLFCAQIAQRDTVAKLRALRDAASAAGAPLFYSRVEVSEQDYAHWTSRNGLQQLMAERRLFEGQGAAWLPGLEPPAGAVLLTPRKGPSAVHSDLFVQLRHRGLETIVLAGMVANLCVESHVRDATDAGFGAVVVGDAVATLSDASHEATLGNFGLLATGVVTTDEVVASLGALAVA